MNNDLIMTVVIYGGAAWVATYILELGIRLWRKWK